MSHGPLAGVTVTERYLPRRWALCFLCVHFQLGATAADSPTQKKAADLFEQAGKSFAASQYAAAAAELIQSLRLDPQQPRADQNLGGCYQLLSDRNQA